MFNTETKKLRNYVREVKDLNWGVTKLKKFNNTQKLKLNTHGKEEFFK